MIQTFYYSNTLYRPKCVLITQNWLYDGPYQTFEKKKLKCKLVKDNKRITKKYRSTSRVRKAVKAVTTKALIKNIITIKSTNPFILRPASESYCFRGHA